MQRAAKAASLFGADGLLARRSAARPRQSVTATERRQGAQSRASISAEDRRLRGPPSYTGAPGLRRACRLGGVGLATVEDQCRYALKAAEFQVSAG